MRDYSLPGSDKVSTTSKISCLNQAFSYSILAFISTALSIVFWFLCFESDKSDAAYVHIVFQFLLAVLCIVTIIIVKKIENELKFSQPLGSLMTASQAVVILNTIVWTIVFVSAIAMRALWQITILEKKASLNEQQMKDFTSKTNSYQYGLFITLMFELFCFVMATLNLFRICSDFQSIRIIQGFFSFFTVGCALAVIYFSIAAYHDTKRDFRGIEFNKTYIIFVVSTAIAAIVFSIALLIFNVKRFFNLVLAFGVCLVLIAIISIILSAISYRKVKEIDNKYNGNSCKPILISIPEKDLKSTSCKNKYTHLEESPYLTCSTEKEVIIWENGEKNSKSACLNYKCCDVMKIWMSKEQLNLFLSLSALVVYAILSGGLCYYLSSVPYKVRVSYKLYLDYFFAIISVILLIIGIVVLTTFYQKDVKNNNKSIFEKSTNYKKMPKTSDFVPSVCVAANTIQTKNLNFGSHSPSDTFIVALKVINGIFFIDPFEQYPKVKIHEDSASSKLFSNAEANAKYLIFESTANDAKSFYENQVKVCPKSAQLVVTLKSYIHNKSKRQSVTLIQSGKYRKPNENTISFTDSVLNAQKELNNVKFGDVNIKVYSLKTGQPIDYYKLWVMTESASCKIHPNENRFVDIHKVNSSEYSIKNLPFITMTIYTSRDDYYASCHTFLVHKSKMNQDLILLDKGNHDSKVLLKWEDPSITLSLFGSFEYNKMRVCRTSFYDRSCLHSSTKPMTLKTNQFDILEMNFGKKEYMVYVKEIISKEDVEKRKKEKENLNEKFFNSNVKLHYYVKELDFPLHESSFPFDYLTFQQSIKDKNLALIFGCINASENDKITAVDKLWVTDMKIGGSVVKSKGQEFPENSFCELYKASQKKGS